MGRLHAALVGRSRRRTRLNGGSCDRPHVINPLRFLRCFRPDLLQAQYGDRLAAPPASHPAPGARTQASKHVWASSHSQAQAACYRLARQFYPTNITLNPSPARCADCPRPAPPPPQKRQGGSSQPAASRCRGPPIPRSVARCCRCWLQDTTPALDQPCMCCHAHPLPQLSKLWLPGPIHSQPRLIKGLQSWPVM